MLQQLLVASIASWTVFADEHTHVYNDQDDVVVWVNTVGPYANRQETYEFHQLPYCVGEKLELDHRHESLGEALQGMELINSGMDIHFKENRKDQLFCATEPLTQKQVALFRYAINNEYWFQMFVDDLPVGAFVGLHDKEADDVKIYTHMEFEFGYNGNQVVEANLTMGNPKLLDWEDANRQAISFTYSVSWHPSQIKFDDRFVKYLDSDFFEHKIHWFSIFNSFMMVVFLTGLVAVIFLKALRRDFARYDKVEELGDLEKDVGDEYGWKQVHGDVFRPPYQLGFLSALIGSGCQLVLLTILVVLYTIMTDLYTEYVYLVREVTRRRSSILTVSIFIYALTATVAGYVSGSFYAQYGGKNWIRTMFLTAGLFPGIVCGMAFLVNFVAISYTSTKAIPFGTMIAISAIWLFLVFPLTLLGTILGRNWNGTANFPLRVNPIPRPVPDKPWYADSTFLALAGGILPFGSIFIEMYFVFTSFWAYKIYYVYGFMLLVVVMLWIVTACVAIVGVYFLLNAEDYRWHWVAFSIGASIGFYVYLYAVHYFFRRTKMYGLFQTTFYFGYSAIMCAGLAIIGGAIAFLAAQVFVRRIYATVKID